jgi:hypothetical protein
MPLSAPVSAPESSCPTCPPPQLSVDSARAQLAACVLSSSYSYCVGAALLSIPVSVRLKTYTPLGYAAIAGTGADLLSGYYSCRAQREALHLAQTRVKQVGKEG